MSSAPSPQPGLLLVLSGPAGVGKDTVWRATTPCLPSFAKAVTCTTRARRPGEEEGVHYFFVSDEEFDRLIRENLLLEWAYVHSNGRRYGVPVSSVMTPLQQGQDVVCVIDVQGAQRIRELFADALLVFLKPPPGRETDILKERMANRGAETPEETESRLQSAAWEMSQTHFYDYEIINDEVQNAAQQLCDVVMQEKAKRAP